MVVEPTRQKEPTAFLARVGASVFGLSKQRYLRTVRKVRRSKLLCAQKRTRRERQSGKAGMGRCAFDLCGNIRFILCFHYICEMKKAARIGGFAF